MKLGDFRAAPAALPAASPIAAPPTPGGVLPVAPAEKPLVTIAFDDEFLALSSSGLVNGACVLMHASIEKDGFTPNEVSERQIENAEKTTTSILKAICPDGRMKPWQAALVTFGTLYATMRFGAEKKTPDAPPAQLPAPEPNRPAPPAAEQQPRPAAENAAPSLALVSAPTPTNPLGTDDGQ